MRYIWTVPERGLGEADTYRTGARNRSKNERVLPNVVPGRGYDELPGSRGVRNGSAQ